MPVQIDRMDTTVEITGARPDTAMQPSPTTTPMTAPQQPQPVRDAGLQSLADAFDRYLRTHGI